jgi:hypothetical protein
MDGVDALEQAEHRRVDGAHHGRGQGHVGFDEDGHVGDRHIVIGHHQGQLDQRGGTRRQVDVEFPQFGIDAHGRQAVQ